MVKFKLLVIIFCINFFCGHCSEYCYICPNHTLCKFNNIGPSRYCKAYDESALLTKEDVRNIVQRINERRNYVALGFAYNLPSAANMRKVEWSRDLAFSAQRWADQCDPAIRPDRKDACRDLVDTKVGQNIATLMDTSSNVHVQSFVETWFIGALQYSGSVVFYNTTRDSNTNEFIQLIWAETNLVGCGRARFSIDHQGTMADRLVCNFAPKGNNQGKPVYTIGQAATECPEKTAKDDFYTGLCRSISFSSSNGMTPVSSLLRIIDLPNKSASRDMDPINNGYKDKKLNDSGTNLEGHHKMRHVYYNDTSYGFQSDVPEKMYTMFHTTSSPPRLVNPYYDNRRDNPQETDPYHESRFTSTVCNYHTIPYQMPETIIPVVSNQDYRKHKIKLQCTRKSGFKTNAPCDTVNKCTRGNRESKSIYRPTVLSNRGHTVPHEPCSCNTRVTTPTQCTCNLNCNCPNLNIATTPYMKLLREFDSKIKKPAEYAYYDNFPKVAVRSNDNVKSRYNLEYFTRSMVKPTIGSENEEPENSSFLNRMKPSNFRKNGRYQAYRGLNFKVPKYYYRSFNPSVKKKRQIEAQDTLIPFWVQDSHFKNPMELKSLKYTTLFNQRRRKTREFIIPSEIPINTELITVKHTEKSDTTEKFLSFEELMHFRKNNGIDIDSFRRNNALRNKATPKTTAKATTKKTTPKATTKKTTVKPTTKKTTAKTTAKPTAKPAAKTTAKTTAKPAAKTTAKTTTKTTTTAYPNITLPPFKPKKRCTRKHTCTWTGATFTDKNGNPINMPLNSDGQGGSRTPPGYVAGCTRTSTCTRDYMERNIGNFSRRPTPASDHYGDGDGDEDYCERRSLDVMRKDSENHAHVHSTTDSTYNLQDFTNLDSTDDPQTDCTCDDHDARRKRNAYTKRSDRRRRMKHKVIFIPNFTSKKI